MLARGTIHFANMDKRRPALILSPDARNEFGSDVIVVPISTRLRGGPWHVRLGRGEGGLRTASIALCEQVTTLKRNDVEPASLGGMVSPARMHEIERAVMRAIGIAI